jgi:hypothetical protein
VGVLLRISLFAKRFKSGGSFPAPSCTGAAWYLHVKDPRCGTIPGGTFALNYVGFDLEISMVRRKKQNQKKRSKRQRWTTTDLKQLKALAGLRKASVIARQLRRTEPAVRWKAHIEGISLAMR